MNVFISASEASSDLHGSHVLNVLKKGTDVHSFGLGGELLQAAGMNLWMHSKQFSVGGGIFEVLSKWPLRSRLEKKTEQELLVGARSKIDVALLIDGGEINLRLAALFHFFKVPVLYFIPPKVWVWRSQRIFHLAQHAQKVLSILPFEEELYRETQIPFRYVGNPIAEQIDWEMSREQALARLNLPSSPSVDYFTVMLGSRHTEIQFHLHPFQETLQRFAEELKQRKEALPHILVPVASTLDAEKMKRDFAQPLSERGLDVHVISGKSHECLKVSRAALVKSGTSTLEAACLGTPMVLAYRSSKSAEWLYRHVVRYRGYVGLVNLFLADHTLNALGLTAEPVEKPVVPEMILKKFHPQKIVDQLLNIYFNTDARHQMLENLKRVKSALKPEFKASELVAEEVLRYAQAK